ncbi:DUF5304 domain-containing protein [Streptomyces sp. NPDC048606]|uniref:DUF5304 domain-containing protein n=1 Tax=Streptomyces sp. NPDC048606 TaxID=3154726 RepID=UPI00343004D9
MSEATDRPTGPAADEDAWARACAEDLDAEKARRRAGRQDTGAGTGTAAEELFKLFEAVADKVSSLDNPLLGATAQDTVRQFVNQAKHAARPVVERNPEVFGHLAAAGSELLAAYRSAVEGHERRWTRERPPAPRASGPGADRRGDGPDDEGPGAGERIDLD